MLQLKCNLKTEPYANGCTRVHNLNEGRGGGGGGEEGTEARYIQYNHVELVNLDGGRGVGSERGRRREVFPMQPCRAGEYS